MGLKAAATGGMANRVPQENIEPGSYPARVVSVIDLGVQPQQPYMGEPKPPAQEIRVTYELVDAFMKDEDGNDVEDKPRWISEDFKLLPLDRDLAVSTKRYKTIDPDNEHDGDWSQMLSKGVMVTVVNKKSKNGKTYDNVGGTTAMRKRDLDKLVELQNQAYFFDLLEPDAEIWKRIPKWLQDKIKGNINYEGSPLDAMLEGVAAPKQEAKGKAPAEAKADPEAADEQDDDTPW